MFDIGFWELIVIVVIALLVIGPEQLPGFVRDLGRWTGRLRRLIHDTRHELERGLKIDEQVELDRKLSGLDVMLRIAPDQQPGFKPAPPRKPDEPPKTAPRAGEHPDGG